MARVGQPGERPQRGAPEGQGLAAALLEDPAAGRQDRSPSVVEAADQAVGPALDGGESRNRSVRPDTGSAANSTPPKRGASWGWTRTAMRAPATSARPLRPEHAVDGVDEARPGRARRAPTRTRRPSTTSRRPRWWTTTGPRASGRPRLTERLPRGAGRARARSVTGATSRGGPSRWSARRPGSTGRPARRARARLAALAPTSDPSTAPSSERSTRSERRRTGGNVSMNARVSGGACTAVAARLQVVACGTKAR